MKAHLLRTSPFLPFLFGLVACSTTNDVADLAKNDLFYVDVPFHTKAPGDREVFVAPMADARDSAALPTGERGFPIAYDGDEFWERPAPEMVADVFVRQLGGSALFPAVSDHASPTALVLKPSLVTFLGGSTAAISGSRSFAEVGVRLQVYGPTGADGKRVVLHDQTYGSRQVSPLELHPVSSYRLIGRALQQTMSKVLTGLDGSNVARSNVPMDLALPAEASTPAPSAPVR